MKIEYKGRKFLEILPGEIKPMAKLRCDLFLYLPVNNRMLKLRDRNFEIDQVSLDYYFEQKKYKCFILDPAEHQDVYDFNGADLANLNPSLPQEIIEKFNIPKVFVGGDSPSKATLEGGPEAEQRTSADESDLAIAQRVNTGQDSENAEEQSFSSELSEGEIATKVKGGSDEEDDSEQAFAADASENDQLQKVKGLKEDEDDFEQSFSPEELAKLEEERKIKAAEIEAELERQFSASDEEEESQTKIWGESAPEESTRIGADIQSIEEKLSIIKPDSGAFTEELKRIAAGEEEEDNDLWRSNLSEAKAREFQATKEDKATAKLSKDITEHLGKLRGEFARAQRAIATSPEDKERIAATKKDLREQIQRIEGVSVILESLDTEKPDKDDLPEHLQSKDRAELLELLESELGEMKDSVLLGEEDYALVKKKIWKIKAKEFAYSAEGLSQLRKEMSDRLETLKESGTSMEANEVKELNGNIEREVKKAKLSKNISSRINDLRLEFANLLDEVVTGDEKKKANEARSAELRKDISKLDQLTASVELGEEIPEKDIADYNEGIEPEFFVQEGENGLASMDVSLGCLMNLENELIKMKMASGQMEKKLTAKIFGDEKEKIEDEAKEATSAELNSLLAEESAASGLDSLLDRVEEAKGNFDKYQPDDLERLDKSISSEVRRASVISNIERAVAEKQLHLQNGLKELAHLGEDPSELEKTEEKELKLQDEIKHLLDLRDQAELDFNQEDPELAPFMPEQVEEVFFVGAKKFSDGKKKTKETVDPIKKESTKAKTLLDKNSETLENEISSVGTLPIRKNSIEARSLGRVQKKLSRFMKEYLETGKEIDPKAIWELNNLLDKEVRSAKAEMKITQQMVDLAAELNAVKAIVPNTPEEKAESDTKVKNLNVKMGELESQRRILEKGGELSAETFDALAVSVPNEFLIQSDIPTAEMIKSISGSIDGLKDELITIKRDSLELVDDVGVRIKSGEIPLPDDTLIKDHNAEERAVETKFRNLISGADGKNLQAGVYAATIFRFFGYDNKEIEEDLILATFMRGYNKLQLTDEFSDLVKKIWNAAQPKATSDEMVLRDLGQAVKMASGYLASPKVITGRLSIDPKVFDEFCDSLLGDDRENLDFELVERARSRAQSGLARAERDQLVDIARQVNKKIEMWKRIKAAL